MRTPNLTPSNPTKTTVKVFFFSFKILLIYLRETEGLREREPSGGTDRGKGRNRLPT